MKPGLPIAIEIWKVGKLPINGMRSLTFRAWALRQRETWIMSRLSAVYQPFYISIFYLYTGYAAHYVYFTNKQWPWQKSMHQTFLSRNMVSTFPFINLITDTPSWVWAINFDSAKYQAFSPSWSPSRAGQISSKEATAKICLWLTVWLNSCTNNSCRFSFESTSSSFN